MEKKTSHLVWYFEDLSVSDDDLEGHEELDVDK